MPGRGGRIVRATLTLAFRFRSNGGSEEIEGGSLLHGGGEVEGAGPSHGKHGSLLRVLRGTVLEEDVAVLNGKKALSTPEN